eukprot:CAMPEP_0173468710 /NCGR_PEP_ID=MMETSP1357-20121228/76989_1 /TAXON_ID=77926 /ORGANISM="Hemiselmis rufescens, Strain PCC563" /LENGTH=238 /DNA_ID=CAMNT_0014436935 /DNA_START=38 /DNA_END=754 /DNA_ORIENTATION=+
MWSKSLFLGALCAASASAFMTSPLAGHSGLSLRKAASPATSIRMVDWSEPEDEPEGGAGADRGQINRSDQVGSTVESRLQAARERAAEEGMGSKSGLSLDPNLKEGDRDPNTGRLILDPLKIPDESQGAPGSWEAYLAMRKQKEGGNPVDAFGNPIGDVKPSYTVQAGTWGPPKEGKENIDDILGLNKAGDVKIEDVGKEQEEWRQKKEQEASQQNDEVEARMAKWMADAAAKKAAGQ